MTIEAPAPASRVATLEGFLPSAFAGLLAPAAGVAVIVAVAVADLLIGPRLSLTLLHVLAVLGTGWLGSRTGALVVAAVGAGAASAVALANGAPSPAVVAEAGVTLAVLAAVAIAVPLLRGARDQQQRAAFVDPLTGALNRRGFDTVAERERRRAQREGQPLSLAYLDLDDFKQVNDAHGRRVADEILESLAAAVSSSTRSTDVLARLGGDEFVLLLPNTSARQALVVVERVRRILEEAQEGIDPPVTASIGLATYHNPPGSVAEVVFAADDLMYEAKARGGDTVVGQLIIGPNSQWGEMETDAVR